jgi:hypothetical protein
MDSGENIPTAIPLEEEFEVGDDVHVRAGWEGSNVKPAEVTWLYKTKRIPPQVAFRLPAGEIEPDPKDGEVVVFVAHFARGLGLPASGFLRSFLDKYKLQPHHLLANAFTLLSSFVSFTEGYLGLRPNIELWALLHGLRTQSVQ